MDHETERGERDTILDNGRPPDQHVRQKEYRDGELLVQSREIPVQRLVQTPDPNEREGGKDHGGDEKTVQSDEREESHQPHYHELPIIQVDIHERPSGGIREHVPRFYCVLAEQNMQERDRIRLQEIDHRNGRVEIGNSISTWEPVEVKQREGESSDNLGEHANDEVLVLRLRLHFEPLSPGKEQKKQDHIQEEHQILPVVDLQSRTVLQHLGSF